MDTKMSIKKILIAFSILIVVTCMFLTGCKGGDSKDDGVESSEINTTAELTALVPENEEDTDKGSAYEEDDPEYESNELSHNSNGKATIQSKDFDDTTQAQSKSSVDSTNTDTTKKIATTLPQTTLPPKATEQKGEWGAQVKNY
ncbi:MAG: hypothetical protein ACI4IG_00245 [Eubacterium sp.]